MRTRTKQSFRVALASLSLAVAAIAAPHEARAEADLFGIGDGHRGAYAAVAANEIVNAYAPLTADAAVNATQISVGATLGDPAGFVPGDLVMLWRATGVAGNEPGAASGAQAPLDLAVTTGGAVGRFEFARVQAATATTLTFTKALTQAFAKDVTQAVKVPEFTTVDLPAATSITAVKWQSAGTGFAGGIVAFLANGAVTNAGAISADGAGFRGGAAETRPLDLPLGCPNSDGETASGYAPKGEGVVTSGFGAGTNHGGRGNRSNGAGGGNCSENGGGGGGHAGVGGAGGNAILNANRGGLGGARLDYSLLSRLSMGGGGGAGEQKNGVGSGGGQGGGVVFVRARSLAGTGAITANGAGAANSGVLGIESDGAGGGGAGGSILIRAVANVTCGSAQTKGGNGGNTAVIGLGTFGPGGGGSGGRVLIQAKDGGVCPVDVTPGAAGSAGVGAARGATAGVAGQTEPLPAPGGNYCFSNPATDPQCANPSPVCDPTTGFCNGCSGPFGGGTPRACQVAVQPVCSPNGSCAPCNGDLASGTAFECQLASAPYCFLTGPTTGACGKCTSNADCTTGHPGPVCNPTLGACGTACTDDSQCKAGKEWCAQGVCVPKTPNGEHVPAVPPIDGECTAEKGKRVCLSAVCEQDDDLCGLKNGSPCEGVAERCRSTICFPDDKLCGKPTGQPCAQPGECRSASCTAGVCTGCDDDGDCATGKVCDVPNKQCVDGCREIAGKSNCAAGKRCSKSDGTIGQCIDGATGGDGGVTPNASDLGLIEGGGCSCRTSVPVSGSPIALAAAAIGAMLIMRRRDERTKNHDQDNDNQDVS